MDRALDAADAIETTAAGPAVGRYGGFVLHSAFQPIYTAVDDDLILSAYEGLVRPRRDGVPVAPNVLLDAATGADGRFVDSLCRRLHLSNLHLADPQGRDLFFNLDAARYESFGVIEAEFDAMLAALPGLGIKARQLVCEIVEEDASHVQLLRLRDMLKSTGIRLAMDDFGAGSSSLARYHDLFPDVVKLDGALFRRLAGDALRQKLLKALARTLLLEGATILVEGIETEAQLLVAREMGATLFQGYGLARPAEVPASFPEVLPLAGMGAQSLTA